MHLCYCAIPWDNLDFTCFNGGGVQEEKHDISNSVHRRESPPYRCLFAIKIYLAEISSWLTSGLMSTLNLLFDVVTGFGHYSAYSGHLLYFMKTVGFHDDHFREEMCLARLVFIQCDKLPHNLSLHVEHLLNQSAREWTSSYFFFYGSRVRWIST